MIREERDAGFWIGVLRTPEVAAVGATLSDAQIIEQLAKPSILPLASEHGGFWFSMLDPFGRVCELHTMFQRVGWGREVHDAAIEAFTIVFGRVDLVVTHEMEDNPRSQPPRSFGFRPASGFGPSFLGGARTWILTADAWVNSPAARRSLMREAA